jgi:hypothetical protein
MSADGSSAGSPLAPASFPAPPATVPPAFVVAIAVMLVSGIGVELLLTYLVGHLEEHGGERGWALQFFMYGRGLFRSGASAASLTLMLLGFAELARRAGPRLDGNLFRAGVIAVGGLVVLLLAGLYLNYWWWPRGDSSRERIDTMENFWRWWQRGALTAALFATASVVVAGRRLPAVRWAAVPLILVTVLMWPTSWLQELTSYDDPSERERWIDAGIRIWIRLGFCGLFMTAATALGRSLPPAPTDMVRAGQGLERVGSGLVARVVVVVVAAFVLIMSVGAQSPSLQRVGSVIFPAAFLIASLAMVTGLWQAASLGVAGAPRLRLYAAAALTTMALVMDALKSLALYLALRSGGEDLGAGMRDRSKDLAQTLPYLTPALWLTGLLLLMSAAERLRRMVPEARVDAAAINAAAASVTIFTTAAVVIMRWAQTGGVSSIGGFVVISLMVALANIVAQLAVARVCHRVGAELREVSTLPTAVATVR